MVIPAVRSADCVIREEDVFCRPEQKIVDYLPSLYVVIERLDLVSGNSYAGRRIGYIVSS